MSLWDIIARSRQRVLEYAVDRLQFRLPSDPVPYAWHDIVARNVPLARALSAAERERLLQVAALLLREVPFEGCQGLVVNDEIRVTIAATAALLLHRLPYPRFTKLVRVLVYPDTFVPVKVETRHDDIVIESDPTLGEAWRDGVVVLSWAQIRDEAADGSTSGNVILHEMAHILDAEDGIFDGTPMLDDPSQGPEWARVLKREFRRQQDAVDAGDDPPLDEYAAKNTAEFFAVATEAYYCSPDRLRRRLPDLYDQLQRFYRYMPSDPAAPRGES